MTGVTNTELASAIQQVIARVDAREDELRGWQSGPFDGGPFGDGRYQITNLMGVASYYKSPARLAHEIGLLTTAGTGAVATAQAARTGAEAALASALQQATNAAGAATTATTKAAEANTFRQQAASSEANALAHRNAAQAAATTAASGLADLATAVTDAQTARGQAVTARGEAQGFRNEAQTFRNDAQSFAASINPVNFAAASHTHTIAQVTGLQTALDAKLGTSAFTWTGLADKPTTFTPATHSHVIADVTGLQAALNLKLDSSSFNWTTLAGKPTTFAPSAHSHAIADVTGLQTALDARAALSHTHTIAQVTGLQSALDGKISTTNYLTIEGNIQAWDSTLTRGVILTSDGAVEIFRTGGGAYIDLKDSGAEDFDVRLQAGGTVLNITASAVTVGGTAVSLAGHTHTIAQVTGLQAALDLKLDTSAFTWAGLSGKPTTFTPATHSHVIADVTGLQTALDAKVNATRLTISTLNPSGGSSGDIWFKV